MEMSLFLVEISINLSSFRVISPGIFVLFSLDMEQAIILTERSFFSLGEFPRKVILENAAG